jgi:hypothetical protein
VAAACLKRPFAQSYQYLWRLGNLCHVPSQIIYVTWIKQIAILPFVYQFWNTSGSRSNCR